MCSRKSYCNEKSLVNRLILNCELIRKCFSPYAGDMLELWAVDLPELYHLNDVIVFSTRGERK
jgi:hypothetical protein